MTTTKSITLRGTIAPNIPIAPVAYDQRYQDGLANTLRLYFNQIDNFSQAVSKPQFGTTADRPVINLTVGQMYFDTDLGIPIWWNNADWVDATGTVV